MIRRILGRHARHSFGENRETVDELLARIDAMDVSPQVSPEDYPTAQYPRWVLAQLADGVDPADVQGWDRPEPRSARRRPELDFALPMGGAR
ncbi:hypothetical protein ACFWPK_33160 [Nocardia sp. NPDC058519]|uniref:hypothetical protein n=1 Tax=Nocardia sp. NPDC058519 TaxID=3346535 RepID=UPI00365E33EA